MVALREVIPSDIPVFYEFQADPVATEMAEFPTRDRAAHDAHWAKIVPDPTNVIRTIVDADTVVGNIASFVADGRRLVGYWIGRDHWNRGFGSRALQLFVTDAESRRPLFAHVAEHNIGSIRVLEKAGFSIVGRQTAEDGVAELVLELP